MKVSTFNWRHAIHTFGVIALIVGLFDPLEGSVVICIGSALISLGAWLKKDNNKIIYTIASVLTIFGVAALFYISSLGGFGGDTGRSWWQILWIIPYPLGWVITFTTLIIKGVKQFKLTIKN